MPNDSIKADSQKMKGLFIRWTKSLKTGLSHHIVAIENEFRDIKCNIRCKLCPFSKSYSKYKHPCKAITTGTHSTFIPESVYVDDGSKKRKICKRRRNNTWYPGKPSNIWPLLPGSYGSNQ